MRRGSGVGSASAVRRWAAVLLLAALVALAGSCSTDPASESASDDGTDPGTEDGVDGAPADGESTSTTSEGATGAVASPGCDGGSGQSVVAERRSFDADAMARWYLLTAPEAATSDDPVPLVLDFHGLAEGAEFHSAVTGYSELAESEGFVVAFPHGTGQPVAWNISSSADNPDLLYVDEVVRGIEESYCIDISRVYATGLSNGALMSSVLACQRADTFAAVAPVAGVVRPEDCDPGRSVPVVSFHGTADPLLPFNGTISPNVIGGLPSATGATTTTAPPGDIDGEGYPAGAAAWAEANGCGEPVDEWVTDSVLRRSWDCPEGAEVVFHMVKGGGHTWPGSEGLTNEGIAAIYGSTNMEIDATALSWEFLREHSLAG
jgi:polyhydroxybutyrate depolymerase